MITKVEAMRDLIEEFGGIATWKQIYDNIERYYPAAKVSVAWKEGLRGVLYREIKNNKNFKRVGLGIFALKEHKEEPSPEPQQKIRFHSFIEGALIEIGNSSNFLTYTPDKTATFKENIFLYNLITLEEIPPFTYEEIIQEVKRIDVLWFNKKGFKFPIKAFEVIDSLGTLQGAFNRCSQLLPFNLQFHIVAPNIYKKKFEKEINKKPYFDFKNRFIFKNYKEVKDFYEKAVAYNKIKQGFM